MPFPDAVQRVAVHCRSRIVTDSAFVKIPGQHRITSCCGAPGKRLSIRLYTGGLDRLTGSIDLLMEELRCLRRRSLVGHVAGFLHDIGDRGLK